MSLWHTEMLDFHEQEKKFEALLEIKFNKLRTYLPYVLLKIYVLSNDTLQTYTYTQSRSFNKTDFSNTVTTCTLHYLHLQRIYFLIIIINFPLSQTHFRRMQVYTHTHTHKDAHSQVAMQNATFIHFNGSLPLGTSNTE